MKQLEIEFWAPVIGYEGLYEISSLGRVMSLNYRRTGQKKILKTNGVPYQKVFLGRQFLGKWFRVHRLVWSAFNGQIPSGYEIDHIDGDKTNNSLSNLRCVKPKENSNNPITKIKKAEAIKRALGKPVLQVNKETGEIIKRFECTMDVQRELGINHSCVSFACKGRTKTAGGYRWQYT